MKILSNKYLRASVVLTILIVMAIVLKECNKPIKYVYPEIKEKVKKRDSIIKVVEYKDSVRIVYVNKWRKIRLYDSIPCDTFVHEIIAVCDTIIEIDSSEIVSLKSVIKQDSAIQAVLSDKIKSDSAIIYKLNKRLKRERFISKAAFVTGLGLGIYSGIKIK